MSSPRILMLRHGQTDYNLAMRLQGQSDIPLNATGRRQAASVVESLRRWEPVRLVSSDLIRAVETATPAAAALGLPVETDERLRERSFGLWEGLTGEEIRSRWPDQYENWRARRETPGFGIESRVDAAERVAGAVRDITAGLSGHEAALVVSHGAALSSGLARLLGLSVNDFLGIAGFENCHFSVLEPVVAPGHEGEFRLLRHNVR